MRSWIAGLALALCVAGPAPAQPAEPRTLAVPKTASWQHAATEMILPPRAGGLARGEIRDTSEDELDVLVRYADPDRGVEADVFLFKTARPDAALWFDRARTSILLRPGWGLESRTPPAPAGFQRPGGDVVTGLRTAFDVPIPDFRSTALLVAPAGNGFLVKVRITSSSLDSAALDALLTRFAADLRWPQVTGERAVAPIADCERPLRHRRARIVRTTGGNTLLDVFGGVVAAEARDDAPPPVYCREPGANLRYGVYRPDGARDSYLVALFDAGIALEVAKAVDLSALLGSDSGGNRYPVLLLGRDSTAALPSFNRLPPPEQAVAVALGGSGPTISVSTGDKKDR